MQINSAIQNKIIQLLQWDDGRYEKFILESGNAYLYAYIKNESEEIIDQIKRSKEFWNWWKHHWQTRDEAFIASITDCIKKDIARQLYQHLHDPATLAAELYPAGEVLGESYANLIQQLNKKGVAA